ncbi:SDR family oxidoreductase [Virgibacillus sp. W0181]|uniref:SDR family oxidoreductase n=1 Tax=Virgibacillus sp. W0181 TaxID=3391581 RepID=UPI003F46C318
MDEKNGKITPPAQKQNRQPGLEHNMKPAPEYIRDGYKGSDKLKGKTAIITGGDSGIGRAISLHYVKEGAKVVIVYLDEDKDAERTKELIENEGGSCHLIAGDVGDQSFCKQVVKETLDVFNKIDILVNNAGEQHPLDDFLDISSEQLEKTFQTNFFGMFYLTQAVMPYLRKGSTIINTSSVTAYGGSDDLIDYASTKGAITAFTRSLSENMVSEGIRINGVAPGPIWTPLIPASFSKDKVGQFGGNTPMKRPGQPSEVAPAYVYLASDDSTYVSGQVLHVNGGIVLNG